MSLIEQLQFATRSYQWGAIAGRVSLRCGLDPDLYDTDIVQVEAQTDTGCLRAALREIRRHRNTRPRLVRITVIAGLDRERVA